MKGKKILKIEGLAHGVVAKLGFRVESTDSNYSGQNSHLDRAPSPVSLKRAKSNSNSGSCGDAVFSETLLTRKS